jgi:hypothetical protein
MTEVSSVLFFLAGYLFKQLTDHPPTIPHPPKPHFSPSVPAGPISYPTPQELKFRGSEEEKRTNEWTKLLQKAGLK